MVKGMSRSGERRRSATWGDLGPSSSTRVVGWSSASSGADAGAFTSSATCALWAAMFRSWLAPRRAPHVRAKAVPATVVADVSGLRDVDGVVVATRRRARTPRSSKRCSSSVSPCIVEKPLCADAVQAARLSEVGPRPALRDGQVALPPGHPGARGDRPFRVGSAAFTGSRRGVSAGASRITTSTAPGSSFLTSLSIALEILGRVPQPLAAVGLAYRERHPAPRSDARRRAGVARVRPSRPGRPSIAERSNCYCADGTASLPGGWDQHVTVRREWRTPTASASRHRGSCPCSPSCVRSSRTSKAGSLRNRTPRRGPRSLP